MDLVQRLHDSAKACRALDRSALLTEAADEIERLRGQEPAAYLYDRIDGSQLLSMSADLHIVGMRWIPAPPTPLYARKV